jgi:hypothetical protein
MWHHLEHHVIRTVITLCSVAGQSHSQDVRDGMRDETSALLGLWLGMASTVPNGTDPSILLRQWCGRVAAHLEVLASDANQPLDAILSSQAAILRLRSALPAEQIAEKSAPAAPVLNDSQKMILEFMGDHPRVRTREITDHFAGSLSDRTVKRCLKELVSEGVLVRTSQDGAVMYSLTTTDDML